MLNEYYCLTIYVDQQSLITVAQSCLIEGAYILDHDSALSCLETMREGERVEEGKEREGQEISLTRACTIIQFNMHVNLYSFGEGDLFLGYYLI